MSKSDAVVGLRFRVFLTRAFAGMPKGEPLLQSRIYWDADGRDKRASDEALEECQRAVREGRRLGLPVDGRVEMYGRKRNYGNVITLIQPSGSVSKS